MGKEGYFIVNRKGVLKLGFIALAVLAVILAVIFAVYSFAEPSPQYEIIGDSVQWENGYGKIIVTPHTIQTLTDGCFEIEATSYLPTQNIDCAVAGRNGKLKGKSAWIWANISHNVPENYPDNETISYTCTQNNFSYQLTPTKHAWCYNDANGTIDFEHDFLGGNLSLKTIWWNETRQKTRYVQQYWFDWYNVNNMFKKQEIEGKDYYTITNISWVQNTTKKVKLCFDAKIEQTLNGWGINEKLDTFCKRSSDTIQEALSSGSMFIVDPWWNISYRRRVATLPDNLNNNETFYITLDTYSLISNGKLDSACSGLHLIYDDGSTTTELDYVFGNHSFLSEPQFNWGNGCNNANSSIYFKIIGDGVTEVSRYYLYYHNFTDTTFRNASKVFALFEDFNDGNYNGWTVVGGTFSVQDGKLITTQPGVWHRIYNNFSNTDIKVNTAVKTYYQANVSSGVSGVLCYVNVYLSNTTQHFVNASHHVWAGSRSCEGTGSWEFSYNYEGVYTPYKQSTSRPDTAIVTNYSDYLDMADTTKEFSYRDGARIIWDFLNNTGNSKNNFNHFAFNTREGSTFDNFLVYFVPANQSFVLGAEEIYNIAPAVAINPIIPTTAYTSDDLNCSFTVTDPDAEDSLSANVSWYKNNAPQFSFNISVTNGALASNILHNLNTTKGQIWNCSVVAYDGTNYSNASSAARNISNSPPNVTSYNTSSLNRTWVNYTNQQNISFQENETVRFAVNVSDADAAEGADTLWYSWFVDSVFAELTQNSWFSKAWDFLSAGLHIVRVDVNDTSNAKTNQTWYVTIADVVNKFWSVDYVFPTPVNNTNLTDHVVNVSVLVTPSVVKAATLQSFADTSQADFNNGIYSDTKYDAELSAVTLNRSDTDTKIQIFFDGFESGALNNWNVTSGASGQWIISASNPYEGSYHASASNTDTPTNMTLSLSTVGYTSINVSYYRWLAAMESPDLFTAEWFDGSSWYTLESSAVDSGYIFRNFSLPASANNNSDFKLRFSCDNDLGNEYCRLDNVKVEGLGKPYSGSGNFTSRVFNASESLSWNTIKWSESLPLNTDLKFQARSCDDLNCNGEVFVGYDGTPSTYYTNNAGESINAQANMYFQYKAFFSTTNSLQTPKLYNVSIQGHTIEVVDNVTISKAWIEFNGAIYNMSGSGFSWSYANNTLDKGGYTYRVYVNDSFGNINQTEIRTFTVPSYNITFNATSGEDGSGLNNITIICEYNGFNQAEDSSNLYGPYIFPVGSWTCTFRDTFDKYFNKTITFNADSDKYVNVAMSITGGLTWEEHQQLDWLYNCWKYGECQRFLSLLPIINETTSKIWKEFVPTNISVVAEEQFINKTLSSSSNISINYTVHIPFKKEVEQGALLPIRIFYWFTDANGKCYNQDKQADSNRAETPYCLPLIAEYLRPNNGTVSFRVDLKPNLPSGTYEVVRQIDIDPPVEGKPVWTNYGREAIGSITVLSEPVSSALKPEETDTQDATEATAPTISSLGDITSMATANVNALEPIHKLIGLAIICITSCITLLGMTYLRRRR